MLLMASLLGLMVQPEATEALEVAKYGFVVVPGAEEGDRRGAVRQQVHYYVEDSFPAARTIDAIVSTLARHGWQAASGHELASYESSSLGSGWDELPQEQGIGLRSWSACWRNGAGGEGTYGLSRAA